MSRLFCIVLFNKKASHNILSSWWSRPTKRLLTVYIIFMSNKCHFVSSVAFVLGLVNLCGWQLDIKIQEVPNSSLKKYIFIYIYSQWKIKAFSLNRFCVVLIPLLDEVAFNVTLLALHELTVLSPRLCRSAVSTSDLPVQDIDTPTPLCLSG